MPSECVEVAAIGGYVLIRDSADKAAGPVLIFSREQWGTFTRFLRHRDTWTGNRDVSLIPDRSGPAGGRLNYPGSIAGKTSEAVTA
jgi:Domain of unknown function (DUF397)